MPDTFARAVFFVFVATAAAACGSAEAPSLSRLAIPDRQNAAPSIAAQGSTVIVAWGATPADGPVDIFTARSDDGGRTFAAPVRVNDDAAQARASGEQAPRVAISGRDVAVLYTAKREGLTEIRVARSADGARTFGPSRVVHPEGLPAMRGWGSIAAGGGGTFHLAWLDGRQSAPTQGAAPHIHGASHGATRQDLYYARLAADGTVVEAPLATDVCFCCKTAVQPVGADVIVAWRHIFPGSLRDIGIARFPAEAPVSPVAAPARVSEDDWKLDACPDDGPAVAADASGALHIAWPSVIDGPGGQRAVFYATSADGRTFSARKQLNDPAAGVASHPQIAVSADGDVTVVWDQAIEGTRRAYVAQGRAGRWSAPAAVSSGVPASYPAAAATPGGALIVWTNHTAPHTEIAVARRSAPR